MTSTAQSQREERLHSVVGELRTILTFAVGSERLAPHLPVGWRIVPHASGPTAGANLRIAITEQLTVEDADGQLQPTPRFAPLVVPAIRDGLAAPVAMVLIAYTTHAGDERFASPYGNGVSATSLLRRSVELEAGGTCRCEENWDFRAASGDRLMLGLSYNRGAARRTHAFFDIYSSARPDFYRIYRIEQGEDVVLSRPDGIDRTSRYEFAATGPMLSPLFDGTERLIAITSLVWCRREVYLPV